MNVTRRLQTTAFIIGAMILVALPHTVYASGIFDAIIGGAKSFSQNAYGSTNTVDQTTFLGTLINIINYLLTFIGIIFFLLLIYAGYLWMTARGNETQVDKAKSITREVVIGLIVIILARLFTEFILTQIGSAVS